MIGRARCDYADRVAGVVYRGVRGAAAFQRPQGLDGSGVPAAKKEQREFNESQPSVAISQECEQGLRQSFGSAFFALQGSFLLQRC